MATGIGSGILSIAANGREMVRATMDARCNRWFITEGTWALAHRIPGPALDDAAFDELRGQNNVYCLNAWIWPSKASDDLVMLNTDAVQAMIAGTK